MSKSIDLVFGHTHHRVQCFAKAGLELRRLEAIFDCGFRFRWDFPWWRCQVGWSNFFAWKRGKQFRELDAIRL